MSATSLPLEYLLPEGLTPEELERRLGSAPGLEACGTATAVRTLLDTADWHLYRQGSVAEVSDAAPPRFVWRHRADGRLLGQRPGPAPRFAWELPPGALRRQLQAAIEVRALLPWVRLRGRVAEFRLRDGNGKSVLHLRLEVNTLLGERPVPLHNRLCLEPVKGYSKVPGRVRNTLLEPWGLSPATEDLATEALRTLGITPPSLGAKPPVALAPQLPAGVAARRILLPLLDAMEANEAGARDALDTEFLHDLRVAVRRTRAALGSFKGVFPPAVRDHFRGEFAWLGTVTTPTRDLDVYRLNIPEYQAHLPAALHRHLEPLGDFLADRQQAAHRELVQHLLSRRYQTLKRDWRRYLEAPPEAGPDAPPWAARPVGEVARKRIAAAYHRALQDGAGLHPTSSPEAFHELRKTCKKLRYLLEFFQSLLAPDAAAALLKVLKALQDNLGVHNDLAVQAAALTRFGQQMQSEDRAPAECLMAMGSLVDDLDRRRERTRGEFAPRFAGFADAATGRQFRQLFARPTEEAPL